MAKGNGMVWVNRLIVGPSQVQSYIQCLHLPRVDMHTSRVALEVDTAIKFIDHLIWQVCFHVACSTGEWLSYICVVSGEG